MILDYSSLSKPLGPINPGNEVPAGQVLFVSRNGVDLCKSASLQTGMYDIRLRKVANSNDVVSWRVEDKDEKPIRRGAL
jgi:hypothetical protein